MNGDSPKKGETGSLARRADFPLGSATVRPSIRTVEGPGGAVTTEPRVMQVLVALADAAGAVLTREDLLRQCWNGMLVGDDAINRSVAEVRRIARATGDAFTVETIPRIGYRLVRNTSVAEAATPPSAPALPEFPAAPTRRRLLTAAVALAGLSAVAAWVALRSRKAPGFLAELQRGREALRADLPGPTLQAVAAFREAVALDPEAAEGWGLLALALHRASESSSPAAAAVAVRDSEQAARRALALDAREPDALATLALLQRRLDDWLTTERKLREVLVISPANLAALDGLVALMQASGYQRESWQLNERSVAVDPLRPGAQQRRAMKHWILGRPFDADRTIARARELWPTHPWVWNSRLLISAFTGQWTAARLQIDESADRAGLLTAQGVETWRRSLDALESRSAQHITLARDANLAAAPTNPALSVHAIMVLSDLGEIDAAYSIVDGLLLRRGDRVTHDSEREALSAAHDPGWRQTQWLFTPATRRLRAHPRFAELCDAIDLSTYWTKRGVPPDDRVAAA